MQLEDEFTQTQRDILAMYFFQFASFRCQTSLLAAVDSGKLSKNTFLSDIMINMCLRSLGCHAT